VISFAEKDSGEIGACEIENDGKGKNDVHPLAPSCFLLAAALSTSAITARDAKKPLRIAPVNPPPGKDHAEPKYMFWIPVEAAALVVSRFIPDCCKLCSYPYTDPA